MYVELCPRDDSDPEAVSGSSTKQNITTTLSGFLLP